MRLFWIALMSGALAAGQSDERALEWLRKAQQRAGGAEMLESIHDVTLQRQMRGTAAGMDAQQTVRYIVADALRQESALPFGRMTVYVNAEGGWMDGPQGLMALPAPQLRQARGELFRGREALLLADRIEGRDVRFLREAEEDGRKAVVLEVAAADGGESAEVWIDEDSGEFYKLCYMGIALAGQPPRVEERYADFREVDGYRLPYKASISQGGALVTEMTTAEVAFNTGTTEEELAKKP
jgi:hypothetical protein